MKHLKNKYFKLLNNYLPLIIFICVIIIFFWKVIFLRQVPIPADLVVGAYFPWLDYKWGYDVGVPVKNLITSDVVSVIYPIRSLAVDLIKSGQSVLWNPLIFGGYPLLANFQVAILSPTMFLYLILPKVTAWSIQIMMQPFLCMLFSYLFLRHIKLTKTASVTGSIVYAFSGFNMIWMEWGAHSLTAAFIPLILYLISRLIEDKNIYWGVLLSLSVTAQIFSGYPQLFIYTMLAAFIYVLTLYKEKLSIWLVFKLVLYVLLGIAGSAIQLIPAMELLRNSQRVAENLSVDLVYLPWQNWITFLAPDFFGNHATGNFWGMGNYTNIVGYTGIIPLCLSFLAIFNYKKNKYIKYFAILLCITLLFSFPFPWTQYLYSLNLPGIGAASLTRILVLTNLTIAYLSAFGIDFLVKVKSKKLTLITSGVILIILVLGVYSYIQYKDGNMLYMVGLRNLFYPMILVISLFVLSFVKYDFTKYLIVLLAVFELFKFGWKYTPFSNANLIYPDTPVTDYLKSQTGIFRIDFGKVIPMNMWSTFNLQSISGYDAAYPLYMAKFIAAANANSALTTPMGRHGSLDNFSSRLFDLSNIKYLLILNEHIKEIKDTKLKKNLVSGSVSVLENKNVLPRTFFVSDWEVAKSSEKTLEKLLDKEFDLKNKIIIDRDFNKFVTDKKLPKYSIKNIEYKSGSLSLDISTDKNGFLFVSDTYYEGWNVFVDGKQTDIYRADYTYRAVSVTKGDHNILFIYDPKSFRIGRLISVLSLLTLITLIIYGYKKNR